MPETPGLSLPAAPHAVPRLSGPGDRLALAAPARPRAFLLTGPGCTVRGVESRAVDGVEHGGRLLLTGLAIRGFACGNVRLAPAAARRELLGRGGALLETLTATASGLLAQWEVPAGGAAMEVDVALSLPGARWRADGAFLRVDDGDGVRIVQLAPAPPWTVTETGGGVSVTARATVAAGRPLALLATAGPDATAAGSALGALSRFREARLENELAALRTRRLAAATGVDEIDDALAWACARIDAAGTGPVHDLAAGEPFPFDPDARRGWTALGALASGGRAPAALPGEAPFALLAAAREAAWHGGRARAAALAGVGAGEEERVRPGGPAERVVRAAGLLAAADAVEPWEGKPRAAALRARAASLLGNVVSGAPGPGGAAGGRGLRLPTVGGGAARNDSVIGALAAALELPGSDGYAPPAEDPPPGLLRALVAWACLATGHADRGFALLRTHLADGFAQGAGLWPDGGRVHDAAAAALVPLVLLHGLLGARADAHYGRLRLAPRLPPHWSRLTVSGIVMGDATVRMAFDAADGRHRFRLTQESGRVPVMLVFEPLVPLAAGTPVWVDGERSNVEVAARHGRAEARVQLPLDGPREVVIG